MNKDELIAILAAQKVSLDMKSNGKRADLRDVDLKGIDLRYANLKAADLSRANLRFADLDRATLIGADLDCAVLFGASFLDANLINANLSSANCINTFFNGADLTGASLKCADLRGANLCDTTLEAADLTGADLTLAKYDSLTIFPDAFDPQGRGMVHEGGFDADEEESEEESEGVLTEETFSTIRISKAERLLKTIRGESDSDILDWEVPNLSWLDLSNCNLTNGNLENAVCCFANFSGADLTKANLANTNLTGANLLGTIMSGAKYNKATIFPNSFDPVSAGMVAIDVDTSSEATIEHIIITMRAEIVELSQRKDFLENAIKEIQKYSTQRPL